MINGWIKLYRTLGEKPIWRYSTPQQKSILITLLMMANHEETEWEWKCKKFKVKPGQFVTSLKSIKEAAGKGISLQNVRTALERFKKLEFLTYKSTKLGRLITIINWDIYQSSDNLPNKDNNKALTKHQQSTNKALTTNKNDKNERMIRMKEEKKEIYKEKKSFGELKSVKLTEEEYQKLIERLGEEKTADMIERLDLYLQSKGKRYKSHYATILAWERKDKKTYPNSSMEKQAEKAWEEVDEKIGNGVYDFDDPITDEVVTKLGGTFALNLWKMEDMHYHERNFKKHYIRILRKQQKPNRN